MPQNIRAVSDETCHKLKLFRGSPYHAPSMGILMSNCAMLTEALLSAVAGLLGDQNGTSGSVGPVGPCSLQITFQR